MSVHGRQLPHKHGVIAAANLLDANVQTVLYRCLHFLEREREREAGPEHVQASTV